MVERPVIGALDQRVTFQRLARVADGMGGATETWADLPTVPTMWARVVPGGGAEALRGGAVEARGAYTFVIRYRDDLREADRLLWRGDIYSIKTIRRRSNAGYLEFDAERGVAT